MLPISLKIFWNKFFKTTFIPETCWNFTYSMVFILFTKYLNLLDWMKLTISEIGWYIVNYSFFSAAVSLQKFSCNCRSAGEILLVRIYLSSVISQNNRVCVFQYTCPKQLNKTCFTYIQFMSLPRKHMRWRCKFATSVVIPCSTYHALEIFFIDSQWLKKLSEWLAVHNLVGKIEVNFTGYTLFYKIVFWYSINHGGLATKIKK